MTRLAGWRPGRPTRAYLVYLGTVVVVGVRGELTKPAGERTWHGRALGAPWDLRRPTLARLAAPHFDPALPIVGEQGFGAGWCLNWGALARRARRMTRGIG